LSQLANPVIPASDITRSRCVRYYKISCSPAIDVPCVLVDVTADRRPHTLFRCPRGGVNAITAILPVELLMRDVVPTV